MGSEGATFLFSWTLVLVECIGKLAFGTILGRRTSMSCTVEPLIIESLWAKKRVSTGALKALDDPLVVQMRI